MLIMNIKNNLKKIIVFLILIYSVFSIFDIGLTYKYEVEHAYFGNFIGKAEYLLIKNFYVKANIYLLVIILLCILMIFSRTKKTL